MRPLKTIFFVAIFVSGFYTASGQAFWSGQISYFYPFLSSDKLTSINGYGENGEVHVQKKINSRFDIMHEISEYYLNINVKGYTDQQAVKYTSEPYHAIGLVYAIGTEYFPVPGKLSLTAGLNVGLSFISCRANDVEDGLGAPSADPTKPLLYVTDLAPAEGKVFFNYGIHAGISYQLFKPLRLSLRYFRDLNNLTAGSGFNTSMNEILLSVQIITKDFSIAKPYQNKLIK